MTSPPTNQDGEIEPQASGLYPGYWHYENSNAVFMAQYFDTFNKMYISAAAENGGNYTKPLPTNIWPAETAAAPDIAVADAIASPTCPTHYIPVADPITSPTIPTHYTPLPTPGPLIEGAYLTPTEGQPQTDLLVYTSPRTPWWLAFPGGAGSSNNLITAATNFDTTISNYQDSKSANLPQSQTLPDSWRDSFPKRLSMPGAAKSSKAATDFESSASPPAVGSTGNMDAPQGPTEPVSEVGLLSPGATRNTNPRRPASLAETRRRSDAQRTSPLLSPTLRPEKRHRNRAAANKCRAKNKAAVAELKASERTESRRREELLATFRALRADVVALKSEILLHANCGDRLIQEYLDTAARSFVPGTAIGEFASGEGWWISDLTDIASIF